MNKIYRINQNLQLNHPDTDWNSSLWKDVPQALINNFRSEGSDHRPETCAKLQYNASHVFVQFRVKDKYVRCLETQYNGKVHLDSCVEWFIRPAGFKGYFNFEMNCMGTLHVNYIIDPTRGENGKRRDVRPVSQEQAGSIKILTSIKDVIKDEIQEDLEWYLALAVPFEFFKHFYKQDLDLSQPWQGNLYKCGDNTSHPHYVSWAPVSALNFHLPQCFQEFIFTNK